MFRIAVFRVFCISLYETITVLTNYTTTIIMKILKELWNRVIWNRYRYCFDDNEILLGACEIIMLFMIHQWDVNCDKYKV